MKISMMPYVISQDIVLLLGLWAKTHGFQMPSSVFFAGWREEFALFMRKVFPSFISVSEEEMQGGLSTLLIEADLPVLSLDGVYVRANLSLEVARQVDRKGKDCGIRHRPGTISILQQIREIQKSGVREVVLVDDVIFSGALIERVCRLLGDLKIRVPVVCAGVGIGEGIEKLTGQGFDIRCVRIFEKVIDEICERDLVPGIPQSGRALLGEDSVGVPYLFPFGDPVGWASIPSEHAKSFSAFCLSHTIVLFEELERVSERVIKCSDLARFPLGLPQDETRFVEALRSLR